MANEDLAFTPAWRLRELISTKELSPVELTEFFLRRIEALNPKLNAYLTVTAEEALSEARLAEQAVLKGEVLGPLHGIPISIKDLEVTKGVPTTLGSLVFKDKVPQEDTVVVERVRKSGAIILGKTNTPEFGLSGTTENRLGDACRNPWNLERTSGGSSGGAGAGLAAGLCPLAIGSDGGGSIRIPSSFCGVYGIKPTQGRVPRYGGFGKPAANLTSQVGPMARNVRDAAILLEVVSGHDSRDPTTLREPLPDVTKDLDGGVRGLRLAWSPNMGFAPVDPEVVKVTSKAARVFDELGCVVEEPRFALEDPFPAYWPILTASLYASFGHLLEDHAEELTSYGRFIIEQGEHVSGVEYSRALLGFYRVQAQLTDLLERYDLLLTPTMPVPAFPIGQRPKFIHTLNIPEGRKFEPYWGFLQFTFPINMSGQTAASVPCGFSADGMPIGLQIVGRAKDEATVLRASAAFEKARPWPLVPKVS